MSTNYPASAEPRAMIGDIPVFCSFDELLDTEKVVGNPRNPNEHPEEQIELLAKIISHQGWRNNITISRQSGFVVKGHGRLMTAIKLGCRQVPVEYQNYATEADEWADLTADNRLAELAEMNDEKLAEILAEINLSDLPTEMTGYTEEDLDSILKEIIDSPKEEITDLEEDYHQPLPPMSKPGDLWLLGEHRLMCGDSTDKETVDRLMDGTEAEMVMTDPPYGINAEKMTMGTGNRDYYRGEDWDSERPDISAVFELAPLVCIWGGNYFADKLPITNDWLIWHKRNDGLSFSECELAWTNFGINCRHISHHWGNEKKQHVTMKPLPVIAWAIERAKQRVSVIVDLFGGSGTTLLACEQLGRTCYMMELDPKYIDVIISRYVSQTGNLGVTCIRDGKELSYIDLVREWAKANGEEERINAMKIPVVVTKAITKAA